MYICDQNIQLKQTKQLNYIIYRLVKITQNITMLLQYY